LNGWKKKEFVILKIHKKDKPGKKRAPSDRKSRKVGESGASFVDMENQAGRGPRRVPTKEKQRVSFL